MDICRAEAPPALAVAEGGIARCWLAQPGRVPEAATVKS
jgi:hypothetical protein